MGLLLRSDAYIAETADGAHVMTHQGDFSFTGRAIYRTLTGLAPHLDGARTLTELTARLSPERAEAIRNLIALLLDRDLIRDVPAQTEDADPDEDLAPYQPELTYLGYFTDRPVEALLRYRNMRAVVLGSGPLVPAVAAAALTSGLRRVRVITPDDPAEILNRPRRDPRQHIDATPLAESTLEPALAGADIAFHVTGRPEPARARRLDDLAAEFGIHLTQVASLDGRIWIGPAGIPVPGGPSWTSAGLRLRARPGTADTPSEIGTPGATVAAARIVQAAFRSVTLPTGDQRASVVAVDPGRLDGVRHTVLPHPFAGPARRGPLAGVGDAVRALEAGPRIDEDEFARRAAACADDLTGVFGQPAELGLAQIPLRVCAIEVSDPVGLLGPGTPAPVVHGIAPDFAPARTRAALTALAAYGSLMLDPRRLVGADGLPLFAQDDDPESALRDLMSARVTGYAPGYRLDGGGTRLLDAAAVFPALPAAARRPPRAAAAGYDWREAVEKAVVAVCHRLTMDEPRAGAPAVERVDPAGLLGGVARRHWEMLAALGQEPVVYDVTGSLGLPTFACLLASAPAACASGLSAAGALSGRSSRRCSPTRPGSTTSPTTPRLRRPCRPASPERRPPRGTSMTGPRMWRRWPPGCEPRAVSLWRFPSTTIRRLPRSCRTSRVWWSSMPEIVGSRALAAAIETAMAGTAPDATGVLVVSTDTWDTGGYADARRLAAESRTAWLPVRAELGRVVIGPVEAAGLAGCVTCADTRRRARRHAEGIAAVLERHGEALAGRASQWLTGLGADLVATLVAGESELIAADIETARTRNAMLYVDLRDLAVTTHRFLPDPLCPECGSLPDDSEAPALITPESHPKRSPDGYRVRPADDDVDELEALYVDPECGLVHSLAEAVDGGLVVAAAMIRRRNGLREGGYGRTHSYRASRRTALLEALERYGGGEPGGRRTVVKAGYDEIQDYALDPRALGRHSAEAYAAPDFPFAPFDPARPLRWVWGHSFARAAPVLVPESYAYYQTGHDHHGEPAFCYEISNGCALGGCLEEAIIFGALEVVERDAFLMTWYARMAAPRLDLATARGSSVPLLAASIESETGYRVAAFDITTEFGVPCVWAMAVRPDGDSDLPQMVCAAGSHMDPEIAAANALGELGPFVPNLARRYRDERERAARMAADSELVRSMEDHSLLYADPSVFGRLDFLTGTGATRDLAAMGRTGGFRNGDLRDDLTELVGRFTARGMDVVVVDQTTPEHRAGGFHCVKVIIPGTLPMTFGHRFRRTDGLDRLLDVPRRLGRAGRRLDPADLNPDPHPFP